ncbi:hypothetical protein D9615_000122 [Tricholomella constricta]|uniref:ACB domain-containing protein n=1 Tax=Tricholomella constricta TaxID=117010 RepID=A0A8H5HR55_9AGAR|nr:hypothetical protein D9615_000122 [Tricholomella constricta]
MSIKTLYDSLYKQATVGNVKTPRPGIWDMLGRAKWDAWAKHRDLDPYEAKWLYVDALLKVLRKYSDKTVAMTLVEELESYGDFAHITSSQAHYRSTDSDSSGSSSSDDDEPSHPPRKLLQPRDSQIEGREAIIEDDDDFEDEAHELPVVVETERALSQSQSNRPPSSLSSHRYRTPMAASVATSPPPTHGIPATQPLPGFETPSAFAEPSPASSPSFPTMSSYVGQYSESSRVGAATPTHVYSSHPQYRGPQQPLPPYGPVRPASRPTLERAIENVQVHLAALNERMESLESVMTLSRSHPSLTPRHLGSPRGRRSPNDGRGPHWDLDDLGMWSIILNPLSRGLDKLREFATFLARNEDRSPTSIIVRRLCLDVSFLICVLAIMKVLWRRSGVRRREVRFALTVLWRAILGSKPERMMMERGV